VFVGFEATANKSINESDESVYLFRLWSFGNSTGVGKWEVDLEIPTAHNEKAHQISFNCQLYLWHFLHNRIVSFS
jgi:hypothetical protein